MLVFQTSKVSTAAGLVLLARDPLLADANGGVRFLFDLAFGFSYAGGAPVSGTVVNDVSEHANSSVQIFPGQAVGFSGSGFDFSALTGTVHTVANEEINNIKAPASVWADIMANQRFMLCMYLRLPASGDWNTVTSLHPFFSSSLVGGGYTAAPDPITIGQTNAPQITFRRQSAIGAADILALNVAGHYGQVAQVAFWRTASGIGARLKTPIGTVIATGAAGSNNSADFSTSNPQFGECRPFNDYSVLSHQKARNWRLYRGFIENLATSGRDPMTVLDADYARVLARGVFS